MARPSKVDYTIRLIVEAVDNATKQLSNLSPIIDKVHRSNIRLINSTAKLAETDEEKKKLTDALKSVYDGQVIVTNKIVEAGNKQISVSEKLDTRTRQYTRTVTETVRPHERFRFELLSVMFGAMQLEREFSRLTSTAISWTGINEEIADSINELVYPAAENLAEALRFLPDLIYTVADKAPWVGWILIITQAFAKLLSIFAQAALFMLGLKLVLDKYTVSSIAASASTTALAGSMRVATASALSLTSAVSFLTGLLTGVFSFISKIGIALIRFPAKHPLITIIVVGLEILSRILDYVLNKVLKLNLGFVKMLSPLNLVAGAIKFITGLFKGLFDMIFPSASAASESLEDFGDINAEIQDDLKDTEEAFSRTEKTSWSFSRAMENAGNFIENYFVRPVSNFIDKLLKGEIKLPEIQIPDVWKLITSTFDAVKSGYDSVKNKLAEYGIVLPEIQVPDIWKTITNTFDTVKSAFKSVKDKLSENVKASDLSTPSTWDKAKKLFGDITTEFDKVKKALSIGNLFVPELFIPTGWRLYVDILKTIFELLQKTGLLGGGELRTVTPTTPPTKTPTTTTLGTAGIVSAAISPTPYQAGNYIAYTPTYNISISTERVNVSELVDEVHKQDLASLRRMLII